MPKKNESEVSFGLLLLILGASQFLAKYLHLSQRTVLRLGGVLFLGVFLGIIALINKLRGNTPGAVQRPLGEIRNRSKRSRLKRKQEKMKKNLGEEGPRESNKK